jgi:hypothetical protein
MHKRIGYLQTSDGIKPHAMSAMPPIATEFCGAAKRRYVPFATDALQHERRKKKDHLAAVSPKSDQVL